MRVPRLYTTSALTVAQSIQLDEAAARYISRVLRMEPGRPLILFNGEGGEYDAVLESVGKKQVSVGITEHRALDRQSPLKIHLGIGLSKGDRFEWVLQKATELGVHSITPLFTERSEVKLNGDRLQKKLDHWRQITLSSCEQCQLNRPPQLRAASKYEQWLLEADQQHKFVLHHRSEQTLEATLRPESVALVIGPEGGLSENEIEQAMNQGFAPLTLGPRVLRTETAPLAAISVMQYLWGDLAS
ncbi:MAG: 16S rRNA (uracil(1498)-N(3))-methyltransferase [Pseudomonadota bacterium]